MSKKARKLEAPEIPAVPNLAAFIRGGEKPLPAASKRYPLTLKLPEEWRVPLKMRLAEENKTIIELGQELFRAYLGFETEKG